MTNQYRIVKIPTEQKTSAMKDHFRYFPQIKRRLLFWSWWEPFPYSEVPLGYPSEKEAGEALNAATQGGSIVWTGEE